MFCGTFVFYNVCSSLHLACNYVREALRTQCDIIYLVVTAVGRFVREGRSSERHRYFILPTSLRTSSLLLLLLDKTRSSRKKLCNLGTNFRVNNIGT